MTYDFETMEQVVNECVSDSTIINSRLKTVSVSYHVKSESINLTKHFTANDAEFIPHWLESMFFFIFEYILIVVALRLFIFWLLILCSLMNNLA